MITDEVGSRIAVEDALDAFSIAVIDKGGIVEWRGRWRGWGSCGNGGIGPRRG